MFLKLSMLLLCLEMTFLFRTILNNFPVISVRSVTRLFIASIVIHCLVYNCFYYSVLWVMSRFFGLVILAQGTGKQNRKRHYCQNIRNAIMDPLWPVASGHQLIFSQIVKTGVEKSKFPPENWVQKCFWWTWRSNGIVPMMKTMVKMLTM